MHYGQLDQGFEIFNFYQINYNFFFKFFEMSKWNTLVLISWYWITYDVNIFIWSWCGAQGKGPTMDLVFYVSAIKIDADGLCASQAQYVWDIL